MALTVFGLISGLLILAYGVLWLSGFEPAAESPYELLFPEPEERDWGTALFLLVAGSFCVGFTVWSWRRLLSGARRASKDRQTIKELKQELEDKRNPPGYN